MMASVVRLGLLLSLFFALGVPAHGGEMSSGPLMSLDERAFDFKELKEGSTAEHTFHVFNKGDQVLEIRRVKTS